jgi:site-specific DNA recombinase
MDEETPTKGFGKLYNPLQERSDQLEEQIPSLEAEIDFLKINLLSSDQILSESKDLYSRWPKLKPEEKRRIVENITEQIIINPNDITINLCYLPISSELLTKRQRNLTGSWRRRA